MKRLEAIESLERRQYFAPLVFSEPSAFSTGANPSDVVAADLTGNGIADVITTNFSSADIAVLRGNGNGTFQSPVFYAVGNSPEALATGDFNGDGIPDIVTANEGSNNISVLIGNGDGTFAPQVSYPVGVRPQAIALADLRGNGLLDIVAANEGSNTVSVLLNNGDGTFAPAVNYFTGDQPDGVALADFNGDGRPDIVTVNPLNNNMHVLLNNGDGTFGRLGTYVTGLAARAVTVATLFGTGQPDIVTTNLHSNTISVFQGLGNGTFQAQQNYGTGSFPFSVTVADLNGDGRPDIITANNFDGDVGVLIHQPFGGFSITKPYHAGPGPVAVAAADVNGDGKPDLIVADFNTSTVSVLTNKTVFVPLIPTTVTLAPGQNPVEVKNRLKLSVQVTPSALKTHPPIGLVQFYDGDSVIGVASISPGGMAAIYPTKLGAGAHYITAHYSGDGVYGQSQSNAVLEIVVPPAQVSPLVAPTITAVRLPRQYVAGDRGVVDVSINDIGDGPARGTVRVQLYASLNSTFDSTAFALPATGNPKVGFSLAGGTSKAAGLDFVVPADLMPGNYTFFALLAPVSGVTAAEVNSTAAVGLNTAQSVLEFGAVGARRGYRLTRTLANGNTVTLALTGPGTGVVTEDSSGGISIALAGTSPGSDLSIISSGVTLDGLSDAQTMGNIIAPTTNLSGAVELALGVRRFTLAGASNSSITIAGGTPNILSLGTLAAVSIFSAAPIRSLAVNSYSDTATDSIVTAWIGSIVSAGDFGASLTINGGAGGRDIGLNSAVIHGALTDSTWSIHSNVASLHVAGVAPAWTGGIRGSIGSFIDTGDFAGNLTARRIASVNVGGAVAASSRFSAVILPPRATVGGQPLATAGDPNFVRLP